MKQWESEKDMEKRPRYCFCRKGDKGEFMVQCAKCCEWFHGLCLVRKSEQRIEREIMYVVCVGKCVFMYIC